MNKHYATRDLNDEEENAMALEIVRLLDGLGVHSARQVLRRAEFWLDAVTTVDCANSSEYPLAVKAYLNTSDHSPTEEENGKKPSVFSRAYVAEQKDERDLQRAHRLPPHSSQISDSPPAPLTD